MNSIKITLIANAGIFIEYSHYKFLIDAIHSGNRFGFGSVSEETLQAIVKGKSRFENVTGVLFTHCHEDHFCAENTLRMIRNNIHTLQKVVLPLKQCCHYPELYHYLSTCREKTVLLSLPESEKKKIEFDAEVSITCFHMIHAGEEYKDIENYGYLFTLGEKKVLILGDADYDEFHFKALFRNVSLHTVIVNPLYLNIEKGRKILLDVLKPENLIVYHIPHGENCNLFLRTLAEKDSKKYLHLFRQFLPSFQDFYCLNDPWDSVSL